MKFTQTNNRGFSLIELIIIFTIIGILAIIAIPKFFNLSTNAQLSVINSIAGSLSSANAENYAARIISTAYGSSVTNCKSIASLLQGGLPVGYKITSKSVQVNTTVTCTLRGPSSTTASFLATGIR